MGGNADVGPEEPLVASIMDYTPQKKERTSGLNCDEL
jgi:hypothetical protein